MGRVKSSPEVVVLGVEVIGEMTALVQVGDIVCEESKRVEREGVGKRATKRRVNSDTEMEEERNARW